MDGEYKSWFDENMAKLVEKHKELLNEKNVDISFWSFDDDHLGNVMKEVSLKPAVYRETKNIVKTDSDGEELALQVAKNCRNIEAGFLGFKNNSHYAFGFFHPLKKHVEVDGSCDEVKCSTPLSLEGDMMYGIEAVTAAADKFKPAYDRLERSRKRRVSAFL
jgi:hypothetical protein